MQTHRRRPSRPEIPGLACLLAAPVFGLATMAAAGEAGPWRRPPERMPLATHLQGAASVVPKPDVAPWIWGPDERRQYRLTKTFPGGAKTAALVATCDNAMQLFVNGTEVATSDTWEAPVAIDVTKHIRDGDNELVAIVRNAGGLAGFSCRLMLTDPDGGVRVVQSDQ